VGVHIADWSFADQFSTTGLLDQPRQQTRRISLLAPSVGHLTDVGAYTRTTSPYGAFHMVGNDWQWNEDLISDPLSGMPLGRSVRGGVAEASPPSFSFPRPGITIRRGIPPTASTTPWASAWQVSQVPLSQVQECWPPRVSPPCLPWAGVAAIAEPSSAPKVAPQGPLCPAELVPPVPWHCPASYSL